MRAFRAVVAGLLACLVLGPSAPARATVELLQVDAYSVNQRGFPADVRDALVRVQNLGSEKRVTLFMEYADGVYRESRPGEYVGPSGAGWELWRVRALREAFPLGGGPADPEFGDELSVKYEVDGQTFYDDNRGRNFVVGSAPHAEGETLYGNRNALLAEARLDPRVDGSAFSGAIDVRNLAFQKRVFVRYTTDGWRSYAELEAGYNPTRLLPFLTTPIAYPNRSGVERFTFGARLASAQRIEFAIRYEVGGRTFWDNNFGSNYVLQVPPGR